jgi:hypothetical protein
MQRKRRRGISQDPAVAAIRARYYASIKSGCSQEEAAAIANEEQRQGHEPAPYAQDAPPQVAPAQELAQFYNPAREPAESPLERFRAKTIPPLPDVVGTGVVTEQTDTSVTVTVIPENWRELEWPKLRSLAASVGSGASTRNRPECEAVIEAALASRA